MRAAGAYLTTSRERLNLSAELVSRGRDGYARARTAALTRWPLVRCGCLSGARRAVWRSHTPADLRQVARICRLVEGIPLAILWPPRGLTC